MSTFKSKQERKIDLMVYKQNFMIERLKKLKETCVKLLNQGVSDASNL